MSIFSAPDTVKFQMLALGLRVTRFSTAYETLFGDGSLDDWSANKEDFPRFAALKTKDAYHADMATLYAHVKGVADKALVNIPIQLVASCGYGDFVAVYDATYNDMQVLRSVCVSLATYEKKSKSRPSIA
jgi:hypothetical protein